MGTNLDPQENGNLSVDSQGIAERILHVTVLKNVVAVILKIVMPGFEWSFLATVIDGNGLYF